MLDLKIPERGELLQKSARVPLVWTPEGFFTTLQHRVHEVAQEIQHGNWILGRGSNPLQRKFLDKVSLQSIIKNVIAFSGITSFSENLSLKKTLRFRNSRCC